jgi:hypothetical protein
VRRTVRASLLLFLESILIKSFSQAIQLHPTAWLGSRAAAAAIQPKLGDAVEL